MKNLRFIILLAAAIGFIACSSEKTKKVSEYPMFWTWMDYRPGMNFDSICTIMNETGIDGVMLNAPTPDDYRIAIPIAKKHGIEVYAWIWTMNPEHDRDVLLKEHPDWFSVNRKGESLADSTAYVGYYKFMCPAVPEVREYIKNKIKSYCEVEGLNGIAIDYHRFVDVILPTTLWSRYGIVQDKEYPEFDYGYHPAMIKLFKEKYGYDPRELEDPSTDEKWLQFRCDQITEVANEIAEVVHSYGKVMAASPFPTPAMSRKMVRQDWGKWNLDIVFPMVYHNFYTGDISFISDCTIENVRDKNPMTTLYCGMTGSNGPVMFKCMDEALKNGAEGIAIFTVGSLRSPEVRAQFKAYADSARAARSAAKTNPAAPVTRVVNTNPFEKTAIMNAVNLHMMAKLSLAKALKLPELKKIDPATIELVSKNALQGNSAEEYISRLSSAPRRNPELLPVGKAIADQFAKDSKEANLKLGEYKLVKEYGATKCYQVEEQNSKVVFDVTFYFYGGILSGWSAEPEKTSFEKYKKELAK
ncbi:MAG TPA: family 10 glycosylhydrolase [Bacteroidales bacterium]|nr:family 10 glycosylhydrolase [Bacteroidales bacterium]HPT20660.1 family 10 glycosylhydrolase [Bacteroidales bacterium]